MSEFNSDQTFRLLKTNLVASKSQLLIGTSSKMARRATKTTSHRKQQRRLRQQTSRVSSQLVAPVVIVKIVACWAVLVAATAIAIESDNSKLINVAASNSEAASSTSQPTTKTSTATTSTSSSTIAPPNPTQPGDGQPNVHSATLRRDVGAKLQQTAAQISASRQSRRVCQVQDGESVAIMEIEESRGSDTSQLTSPSELPISGSVALNEIELKIESETHKYFTIQDKSLKLIRPLDRDTTFRENSTQTVAQQAITSIYLQISCLDKRPATRPAKKTIIPVLVKVLDLNDNAPKFSQPAYLVQVNELAPVGTVILDQIAYAVDLDSANNGQIEYSLLGGTSPASSNSSATLETNKIGDMSQRAPSQTTATGFGQIPVPISESIVPPKFAASQRLIQRAEPVKQHNETSTTTTTTTTKVVSDTTPLADSSPVASTVAAPTSSQRPAIESSSSVGADSESGADAEVESDIATTLPVEVEQQNKPNSRHSNGPTINLNSEPILNGPMEDSETDEENDEALLASINASSGNSTDSTDGNGDGGGGSGEPIGDQSDFASSRGFLPRGVNLGSDLIGAKLPAGRRRLIGRKRAKRELESLTTTVKRVQLPITSTTHSFPASSTPRPVPQFEAASSGSNVQPPWTNLMVIPSDEFQSMELFASGKDADRRQAASVTNSAVVSKEATDEANHHSDQSFSSNDFFQLELSPLTNRPVIKLKRQLDYETHRLHQLVLVATDRAQNRSDRLSSRVQILIRVLDGDDQPPAFILDQVGCATGLVPQATSPLPPAGQSTPSPLDVSGQSSDGSLYSASVHDLLQQEASDQGQRAPLGQLGRRQNLAPKRAESMGDTDLKPAGTNLRLRSFKVTDENFDFGDTLGLDDAPLDSVQHQHETIVQLNDDNESQSENAVRQRTASRTRRIIEPTGQVLSSDTQLKTLNQRHSNRLIDYLCLTTTNQNAPGASQQLAEYFATVISGDSDYLLRVAPQAIKARDRDELNAPIRYAFLNGTPTNFSHYFQIDPLDATIKQVAPIERVQVNEFVLFIQAQEQNNNRLFSVARLTIDVLPTDKSPPLLVPNSYSGFVDENSPLGTRVLVSGPTSATNQRLNATREYLRISLIDGDKSQAGLDQIGQEQKLSQVVSKQAKYEFETTSDAFKVDRDGFVYVNKFPLDRDPPGQPIHMLQVTARQVGLVSSRSISSPISLNITLNDLNDNPPKLLNVTFGRPIQLAANTRGGVQQLIQLESLDRDSAENSRVQFSIEHVSNMGSGRFRIDSETGRIEAMGRFQAGEQFSLTVQASDELGRSSQAILDVQVVPGANSGGPQFVAIEPLVGSGAGAHSEARGLASSALTRFHSSGHYSVEVDEGVPVNSVVLQVRAIDPENDPISYSLLDGNINQDFAINSKTGTITVNNKLDREEISAYKLLVQARDSGGLATSKLVHVAITDSNDQNPIFSQAHYVFSIEEGVPRDSDQGGHLLGRVSAHDSDEGENGRLTYSLVLLDSTSNSGPSSAFLSAASAPYAVAATTQVDHQVVGQPKSASVSTEQLFEIDRETGDIRLMKPLDYESVKWHTLMVVARDNGEMPRSSSAMVQVRVLDRQDELPYFEHYHQEIRLNENQPNQRVALVQARDPDSVAEITYVLLAGDSNLFQVDSQTGLVSTTSVGLDYEQARRHSLLIGTSEAQIGSNLTKLSQHLNEAIARKSQAVDEPNGHQSGVKLDERWPLMRLDVLVNDLNDNAPQFESNGLIGQDLVLPIRVQDSVGPGALLPVEIRAHDLDGSPANNQIRYELVTANSSETVGKSPQLATSDRCARLFLVDPTSGQISVRADLKRDARSECQLVIRARDTPQNDQLALSSTISLTVYIDHLVEISAANMISFADSQHTVELAENAPANTLVKVLTIINKPKAGAESVGLFPSLVCEILSGNEQNRFYVIENEQRDCELRTRDQQLDFEQKQRYLLKVTLNTLASGGVAGSASGSGSGASSLSRLTVAQVQINLLDRNDNRPIFAQSNSRYSQLIGQNKYLAAIAYDSPSETQLIQLRASDLDSSQANGLVSYKLLNSFELDQRFKVDSVDGIVRTSRPVEDLPPSRLPIKLRVLARDNPEQSSGESPLESVAEVVVNLIDDRHRLALVLKDTPAGRVLDNKEELLAVLQERTGLISGLERVESLKVQRNLSTIEADLSGSDVWFYLIEPGSLRLVPSDDPRLRASLFEKRAQNSLADILQQNLSFGKARVRLPYALTNELNGLQGQSVTTNLLFGTLRAGSNDRLAPALIIISLVIALISVIVVIYQCGSVAGLSELAQSSQCPVVGQPNYFAKDKFIFSPPPPPPAAFPPNGHHQQYRFGELPHDTTPLGSLSRAYSTSSGNQTDQYVLTRSSFKPPAPESNLPTSLINAIEGDNNNNNNNNEKQPTKGLHKNNRDSQMRAKEYETQMLKMTMLFDDVQSFDDQNLQNEQFNNIVSKNLV